MGNIYSDILYARPSFLSGMARVIDIAGTFDDYNYFPTPQEAELQAMKSDFRAVGNDIKAAMAQYNNF